MDVLISLILFDLIPLHLFLYQLYLSEHLLQGESATILRLLMPHSLACCNVDVTA
jgi:hypothetical protein